MVSLREEDGVYSEGGRRSPPASILRELGGGSGGSYLPGRPFQALGKAGVMELGDWSQTHEEEGLSHSWYPSASWHRRCSGIGIGGGVGGARLL